ncbi:MAG TPA: HAD family hydrolase [Candidatus Saccharimonadia bacterium]|nr:HAD family hydrolase [Candidatus Saccharimonadia bacterium]
MTTPILFDIDKTLIDTEHLRQHMQDLATAELKISKEVYEKANKKFVSTLEHPHDFHPTGFFQYLEKHHGSTAKYLLQRFYEPAMFESFAYPDVLPALKRLSQSHPLGIFSEGFASFQTKKLELSGLMRYFNPGLTFIFRRKLSPDSLALVPKNALIIDDALDVVKALVDLGYSAKLIDRNNTSPRVKNRISSLEEL